MKRENVQAALADICALMVLGMPPASSDWVADELVKLSAQVRKQGLED